MDDEPETLYVALAAEGVKLDGAALEGEGGAFLAEAVVIVGVVGVLGAVVYASFRVAGTGSVCERVLVVDRDPLSDMDGGEEGDDAGVGS